MKISSIPLSEVPAGLSMETTIDGETISTYVLMGVTDLNAIASIVPVEKVQAGAEIHATRVNAVAQAEERIDEVLGNMNPGDVAVFLCSGPDTYAAALDLLGFVTQ